MWRRITRQSVLYVSKEYSVYVFPGLFGLARPSKHQQRVTQWHGVVPQKNGANHKAVKTCGNILAYVEQKTSYTGHFFFFFSRRYNPRWVLACFTISFHNLLSLHFSVQFLTFIFFKSSSTWSSHLNLGLPTGLDEHDSHSVNFLTVLVLFILITCPAQRNLCDFINLKIFFFLIRFSNSSFVFILHAPSLSLSCVGNIGHCAKNGT